MAMATVLSAITIWFYLTEVMAVTMIMAMTFIMTIAKDYGYDYDYDCDSLVSFVPDGKVTLADKGFPL